MQRDVESKEKKEEVKKKEEEDEVESEGLFSSLHFFSQRIFHLFSTTLAGRGEGAMVTPAEAAKTAAAEENP